MSDAAEVLGPAGPFASALPRYEARPGQLEMAVAVEKALGREHVLFCEAGTGTGKTLAYLVPALQSGKKVIISTATRALQEQLLNHDVPTVEKALGRSLSVVLLKGLGNYLCRRRFQDFKSSRDVANPKWAGRLDLLQRWQEDSPSGDIAELSAFAEGDDIFDHIVSSSDTRIGPRCAFHEQCFVTRAKRAAAEADVVIVNHHLFFADLALRGPHPGRVLPDYDAVIFDEAHQLEDVATLFFGVRVSKRRIASLLVEAERYMLGIPELALSQTRSIREVERAQADFWKELSALTNEEGRVRLEPETWTGPLHQRYLALDTALMGLSSSVDAARDDPSATRSMASFDTLESVARRVRGLRDALATVVDGAPGRISWIDREKSAATLSSSPVDLSGLLRQRVFDSIPAVVMTSATLATHGENPFGFVRKRLGADECEAHVEELLVGSPFDFKANSLLYLTRRLPEPNAKDFISRAVEETAQLIEASDGGAFVLTTSLRSMRELHAELGARLKGRELLLQGSSPKRALLDRFQRSGNGVLVATMSFWEGVDVPGRALRLVVLEKIPFAVPTDPLVQARATAIEEAGGNPFRELFLPAAQMMLKQGFGRLIRSRDDRGVVALLDSRVFSRGYGQSLLGALPAARRVVDLAEACRFLQEVR